MNMPPPGRPRGPLTARHATTCVRTRRRAVGDLDAVGHVKAVYRARVPVPLAVHPQLAVVVDVRLEPDLRPGDLEVSDPLRQRYPDPVPAESEAYRTLLSYARMMRPPRRTAHTARLHVVDNLPVRVVIVRQTRGTLACLRYQPFVRLSRVPA